MDIFMEEAIREARLSLSKSGIPIGSVLVKNGEIVGRGHNRRVQDNDPIMHAEINCIHNAGRIKKYDNTVLYSTLIPCYLCSGAIVQFGIKHVVVGESKNFTGAKEFLEKHGVSVVDLDLQDCKDMLSKFINENSDLWNEDIAEI